jgi:hypothetical protein
MDAEDQGESTKQFTFDRAYDDTSTQRAVFQETAKPIVDSVIQGFNGMKTCDCSDINDIGLNYDSNFFGVCFVVSFEQLQAPSLPMVKRFVCLLFVNQAHLVFHDHPPPPSSPASLPVLHPPPEQGTGKTFTMEGVPNDEDLRGIMPNTFNYIFDYIDSRAGSNVEVRFFVSVPVIDFYWFGLIVLYFWFSF